MKIEVAMQQVLTEYGRHADDDDYSMVSIEEVIGVLEVKKAELVYNLQHGSDTPKLRRILKELGALTLRSMVDQT